MVKKDAKHKHRLPNGKGQRGNADYEHLQRPPAHRQGDFAEMGAQSGGGVHVKVGMMWLMEAPTLVQIRFSPANLDSM